MPQQAQPREPRRSRVLIPLDAEAALRALMAFHHSREQPGEPPAVRDHSARD
jgi:hypothetical protein